jgi:transcriptional regulator with XRE-family HTH domain
MPLASLPTAHFGGLLRRHRLHAGLTQQELADLSTLSVRALRDLEGGRVRHPRRDTVRLLSAALRLSGEREAAFTRAGQRAHLAAEPDAPGQPGDRGGATGAAAFTETPLSASPEPPAPPGDPTDLPGRRRELSTLVEQLARLGPGLVTVTGLPGVGKTRLIAVAVEQLRRVYGHELLWTTPEAVRSGDALAAADDRTTGRPLLVIDGCDTPPDGWGAPLAHLRLRHAPYTVLATRRAPFGVAGEQTMPLAPLLPRHPAGAAADPLLLLDQPAVRLFLTRARLTRPGYRPAPADAERLTELCRLLDGLPRALERAADWSAIHPLSDLLGWAAEDALGLLGPALAEQLTEVATRVPQRQAALLTLLAGDDRCWTLAELSRAAGRSRRDLAQDLHALMLRGLLRSAGPGEAPGFTVPRLVVHARAAAQATAGRLPVQLPEPPGSCA